MQADADGDEQGEPLGRDGRGRGAGGGRAASTRHEPVEPHQSDQADAQPGREDQAVGGGRAEVAVGEGGVDGFPGVGEDVPQQEDQDADGQRVERAG